MGKSNYQRKSYADNELVNYATNNSVSIAEVAERLGFKDTEFYSVLHNPMTTARRYEIKKAIDDVAESKKITTPEVKTEEFSIDDLNFTIKTMNNNRAVNRKDVCISINSARRKNGIYEYPAFSFRNNSWSIVTSTGFLSIALYKNRIYFREEDSSKGYKVGNNSKGATKVMKVILAPNDIITLVKEHYGSEYDLQKDERLGLYYIEVE